MYQEALINDSKIIWPLIKTFNGFYLAGGTALALQIGHRISVDFDLFSVDDIDKNLLQKVRKTFGKFAVSLSVNNPCELTIFVGNVKTTFLKYPFPIIENLVKLEGLPALSIREIAATKAYTIGRRGTYKDYVDLYFIISENHASLKEIIDLADNKFGSEFNSRLFLEQLVFMDDIEDTEVKLLKSVKSKEVIFDFFTQQVKDFSF